MAEDKRTVWLGLLRASERAGCSHTQLYRLAAYDQVTHRISPRGKLEFLGDDLDALRGTPVEEPQPA